MSTINHLQGYAFAKKKGDCIDVFEGPHTLADFMPVIAEGSDVPRMLKDRFADVVNVKDFGAKGDGVTDDSAAFASIEESVSGATVDLGGRTFVVGAVPRGNLYENGAFLVDGALVRPDFVDRAIAKPADNLESGYAIYDFPYKTEGVGKWLNGCQSITQHGGIFYVLERDPLTNHETVHRYTENGTPFPTYEDSSLPSTLGHQGLCVDAAGRLVSTGTPSNYLSRCVYVADQVLDVTQIKLFGEGFVTNTSSTPSLSADKRILVAHGRKTTGEHILRFWDYALLESAADVSSLYAKEFAIPEMDDDDRPVQGVLIYGKTVILVAGDNAVQANKLYLQYDFEGNLLKKDSAFSVGLSVAQAFGNAYEPEGLLLVNTNSGPVVGYGFIAGARQSRHVLIMVSEGSGPIVKSVSLVDPQTGAHTALKYKDQKIIITGYQYQDSIAISGGNWAEISSLNGNLNLRAKNGESGVRVIYTDSETDETMILFASYDSATYTNRLLRPGTDNTLTCGSGAFRWSQVYAGTGAINTSDAREKTAIAGASDALLDAVGAVPIQTFLFADAVAKKGSDGARVHAGVVAQEVQQAFEAQGLDANRYGLFCHDEWQDEFEDVEVVDQPEAHDENGEVVTSAVTHTEQKKILSAGDRYGIRYEELLVLECARLRRELARIKASLTANGITV